MTRLVVTCDPADSIAELMAQMTNRRIRDLPMLVTSSFAALSALASWSRTGLTRSNTRPSHCARLWPASEPGGRPAMRFFYDTLMDCDLLSLVLGRPVERRTLKPALLRGCRRSAPQGLGYPAISREPSAWVRGLILDGVSEVGCARLRLYEGADYVLKRGVAESPLGSPKSERDFEPRPDAFVATGKPWSLALWRLRVKPSELRRLA